jgi:hypothetical protein
MPTHWNGTPFVRVYATLKDDHPAVWFDDAPGALGWFVRLLEGAEPRWPASAPMPVDLPLEVLELLVAEGLVETGAGGRTYRIPSLDAERGDRLEGRAVGGKRRAEQAERDELGRMLPATDETPATNQQPTSIASKHQQQTRQHQPATTSKPAGPAPTNQPTNQPANQPAAPAGRLVGAIDTRTRAPARAGRAQAPLEVNPRYRNGSPGPVVSTALDEPTPIKRPVEGEDVIAFEQRRSSATADGCADPAMHRKGYVWRDQPAPAWHCPTCEAITWQAARDDPSRETFQQKAERIAAEYAARGESVDDEPEGLF